MSKIKFGATLCVVFAWVGLFACSGGGGGTSSCLAAIVGESCFSCLQSRCGSALSGFESACTDVVSCYCPAGNVSCSALQSGACDQSSTASCTMAATSVGNCEQQNCKAECDAGGDACDGGLSTSTTCVGQASPADGGACTNGAEVSSCSSTSGSTTTCYYLLGAQKFPCTSCTDTTSCAQAANAACHP